MNKKRVVPAQSAVHRFKCKKGQTLVEYALILTFISVLAIVVLSDLGREIVSIFTTVIIQLADALQRTLT